MENSTYKYVNVIDGFLVPEQPRSQLSPGELIDTFSPECIPVIKKNLKITKQTEKLLEELCEAILDMFLEGIYNQSISDEEKKYLSAEASRIFYNKPLDKIIKQRKKLESLLKINEMRSFNIDQKFTQADIARAKSTDITKFLTEAPNQSGFIRCPFHEEKTASCKIYLDDNRFHCFGCGERGDVIDLVMHQNKIEFFEAINKILCH